MVKNVDDQNKCGQLMKNMFSTNGGLITRDSGLKCSQISNYLYTICRLYCYPSSSCGLHLIATVRARQCGSDTIWNLVDDFRNLHESCQESWNHRNLKKYKSLDYP